MKFTVCLAATLLALCLVLQPSISSATYSSKLTLSKETTAIIEELQSAIEGLKGTLNLVKNIEQIEALMQVGDDNDGVYIQQRSSLLVQLQLALRDLIQAIARLERSIRQERRG